MLRRGVLLQQEPRERGAGSTTSSGRRLPRAATKGRAVQYGEPVHVEEVRHREGQAEQGRRGAVGNKANKEYVRQVLLDRGFIEQANPLVHDEVDAYGILYYAMHSGK